MSQQVKLGQIITKKVTNLIGTCCLSVGQSDNDLTSANGICQRSLCVDNKMVKGSVNASETEERSQTLTDFVPSVKETYLLPPD